MADTALRRCTLCPADPMNALQSLTGGPAAGAAGIGLPARGPGQPLGGMGGLGAMGQPMPLSGQPPPGTSGMAPHGMAVVSTAAPQSEYHASQRTCRALHRRRVLFPAGGGGGEGARGAGEAPACFASQRARDTEALLPRLREDLEEDGVAWDSIQGAVLCSQDRNSSVSGCPQPQSPICPFQRCPGPRPPRLWLAS